MKCKSAMLAYDNHQCRYRLRRTFHRLFLGQYHEVVALDIVLGRDCQSLEIPSIRLMRLRPAYAIYAPAHAAGLGQSRQTLCKTLRFIATTYLRLMIWQSLLPA